jgi:hypothetical protein
MTMFGLGKSTEQIPWNKQAEDTMEQALAQFPGPKLMLGPVKSKLRSAAEKKASELGHSEVQPEDLMQGLMEMLPQSVRDTIEKRMQEGPEGVAKLQDDLKNFKR